jgi:hypothetical protein
MQIGGQDLPRLASTARDEYARQTDPVGDTSARPTNKPSITRVLEGASEGYGSTDERWRLLYAKQLPESLPMALNTSPSFGPSPSTNISRPSIFHRHTIDAGGSATVSGAKPQQLPHGKVGSLRSLERPHQQTREDHTHAVHYPFLDTDFTSNIPSEDLKYLEYLGCFQLPLQHHLHELVRAYFLYVHPHLPIINEGQFWDTYLGREEGGEVSRLSLFVFQAMLLVSCSVSSQGLPGLLAEISSPTALDSVGLGEDANILTSSHHWLQFMV